MSTSFKLSLLGAAAGLWLGLAGSASAGPLYQSCIWLLPDPATGQIFYNGSCDTKHHARGNVDRKSRSGPEPDPDDCDCVPKSTPRFSSLAVGPKSGKHGRKSGGDTQTVTTAPPSGSVGPGAGRGGKRGR